MGLQATAKGREFGIGRSGVLFTHNNWESRAKIYHKTTLRLDRNTALKTFFGFGGRFGFCNCHPSKAHYTTHGAVSMDRVVPAQHPCASRFELGATSLLISISLWSHLQQLLTKHLCAYRVEPGAR